MLFLFTCFLAVFIDQHVNAEAVPIVIKVSLIAYHSVKI
jgi:hypothetical protein